MVCHHFPQSVGGYTPCLDKPKCSHEVCLFHRRERKHSEQVSQVIGVPPRHPLSFREIFTIQLFGHLGICMETSKSTTKSETALAIPVLSCKRLQCEWSVDPLTHWYLVPVSLRNTRRGFLKWGIPKSPWLSLSRVHPWRLDDLGFPWVFPFLGNHIPSGNLT